MLTLRSLLMMLAVVCLFSACSKDEETPTYPKSDFIGVWSLESTEGEAAGEDYNMCATKADKLEITDSEITTSSYNEDCLGGGLTLKYEFDGKNTLTSSMGDFIVINTIQELSVSRMKIRSEVKGLGAVVQVYTK